MLSGSYTVLNDDMWKRSGTFLSDGFLWCMLLGGRGHSEVTGIMITNLNKTFISLLEKSSHVPRARNCVTHILVFNIVDRILFTSVV